MPSCGEPEQHADEGRRAEGEDAADHLGGRGPGQTSRRRRICRTRLRSFRISESENQLETKRWNFAADRKRKSYGSKVGYQQIETGRQRYFKI